MDYLQNYKNNFQNPLTQNSMQQALNFQNQNLSLTIPQSSISGTGQGYLNTLQGKQGGFNGLKLGGQSTSSGGLASGISNGGGGIGAAGVMGYVGQASDMLGNFMKGDYENNDPLTDGLNTAYDASSSALLKSGNPVGMVVGGGMKALGALSDGLNNWTDGATTVENAQTTSDKIMNSKFLSLTPVGLANSLGKESVEGSNKDVINSINRGYQATSGIDSADFGGITKFFGGKKVKNKIEHRKKRAEQTDKENFLKSAAINQDTRATKAAVNSTQDIASKNKQKLTNYNSNMVLAKYGAKIKKLAKEVIEQRRSEIDKVESFSKGGAVNVIPDGALHARKHNLELEGITKKGIPVVSYKDGDKIEVEKQHAEVEVDEVILHISLTKQLEKLTKAFNDSDDKKEKAEIATSAGKLLATELLDNTEDNTGLIDKVK